MEGEDYRDRLPSMLANLDVALAVTEAGISEDRSPIERIGTIWSESDPHQLIEFVFRRQLTSNEDDSLVVALTSIMDRSSSLPPRQRYLADRCLYRLLHKIPIDKSGHLISHCLRHPRKTGRNAAYRALWKHGVRPGFAELLWMQYGETGEQQLLRCLACSPDALIRLDAAEIIANIEEKYFRTRAIQSLLSSDRSSPRSSVNVLHA